MGRTRREWISIASAGLGAATVSSPVAGAEGSTARTRLPWEVWAASASREGIVPVSSEQAVQAVLERMEQTVQPGDLNRIVYGPSAAQIAWHRDAMK